MLWTTILPFFIYFALLFVICYAVSEFAQDYLYDESTPHLGLKTVAAAAILAAVLTYTHSSYDTMFTERIHLTAFQAVVWFAVFTLVLRFHPPHAAAIGIVTMMLCAGLTTLAVDGLTRSNNRTFAEVRSPTRPQRVTAKSPVGETKGAIKPAEPPNAVPEGAVVDVLKPAAPPEPVEKKRR